ncbi:MAG: FAD-binding protein [Anaerorhabdus sp.]|uniref:FAD-binding protein n=1 Tax=Anaerorhabdus sp. TaxID=1872524 RepID=UPI002B210E02|nr:FAD-binding protein [Anaerorhabdus sp.]MEA4875163.1 FAD-binding protein [Anaerorhabdus sp.]
MKKLINKVLVLLLALGMISGCTTTPKTESQPTPEITADETKTADVIIVGAGGAGLAAALSAVENGAESVIILEKTGTTGGALNYTSGSMSGANTIIQKEDGIEDTVDSYVADIMKNGAGKGDEELIRVYAEKDIEMIQWLWDNGLKDNTFSTDKEGRRSVFAPEHALYSVQRTYKARPDDPKTYKSAAHEVLDTQVKKYDQITIDFMTEATQLIANDKGQVVSVLATNNETHKTIKYEATKGIIMATGGYSGNNKLMGAFAENGSNYLAGGSKGSDGYGIYMMQQVGGYVNDETMAYIPTFPMGLEGPNQTGAIAPTYTWKTGGICVNQNGERFVDETEARVEVREVALEEQPGAVQYDIFTDKIIEDLNAAGAATMWNYFYAEEGLPGYSKVSKASSIEELADMIGVPAETLSKTVEDYNAAVDSKGTDSLGRKYDGEVNAYNLAVNKIEGETYYAVPLKALVVITLGGVTANKDMQVLDAEGNAIPGLYAAGEVVGGIWGQFASGGTGVMGPIVFGNIAGEKIMTNTLAEGYTVKPATNMLDINFFTKEEVKIEFDMNQPLNDGEYQSVVDGQYGEMKVQVTITDGKISDVKIVSNNETEEIASGALKMIPEKIVESNSVEVDVISGATLTTNRIRTAVVDCLNQAKK